MSDSIVSVPEDHKQWSKMASSLKAYSIYNSPYAFNSASKATDPQFLLLRAIYKIKRQSELDREEWFTKSSLKSASITLRRNKPWNRFLEDIDSQDPAATRDLNPYDFRGGEIFAMVRYYQIETTRPRCRTDFLHEKIQIPIDSPIAHRTRAATLAAGNPEPQTPTPAPRGKSYSIQELSKDFSHVDLGSDTEPSPQSLRYTNPLTPTSPISAAEAKEMAESINDEQIVNTALILLLNALSMCSKKVKARWTLQRESLILGKKATPSEEAVKMFEARVDGILQSRDHKVKAIVEVKPCLRESKDTEIRMQETAQMAAWICHHPPDTNEMRKKEEKARRLLISQDACEIYLTFAEFDADYVDYVCGKLMETKSFLEMNEFGPFDTKHRGQMRELGRLLLAFTIDESLKT
ncbi:hypothetical protein O1611_g5484 [Lasiodiplodia mahajangana]|uniref:Uncharacterized protein n=1 Tax=Lasiodiplodia mahajangana TaxID=1108764 RepID=A0ACC2JLC4_9PEZI|nr:hypothetical protein O1611_g5484 [Lasiodiplodia mahajangana]